MEITKGIYQLDCTKQGHVFYIRSDEGILIDTGMPGLAEKILVELASLNVPAQSIKKILLTHHDVDHIGNAKALQDATDAEIWAPKEDVPYIMGEKKRPGFKRMIETFVRPPKPQITGTYQADQCFGEVHIIHAPGHTPGHSIIQYRNILFIGDLFKESNGKLEMLPKFMNWNHVEAKKAISIIKDLKYDWICPSHGMPINRGAVLDGFIEKF
nr:MBL fold metallo-hydrolase [uncultured Acetobacterium sp.]